MRILVAAASRHGATHDMGQWLAASISDGMRWRNIDVDVDFLDAADVDTVRGYDAIVLGSAVYMGRWLRSARTVADDIQSQLESTPVWLFSSGPIGQHGNDSSSESSSKTPWAVEHRTFGGKLDRSTLSWLERAIVTLLRAGDGDDRPRADIAAWGESICTALAATTSKYTTT